MARAWHVYTCAPSCVWHVHDLKRVMQVVQPPRPSCILPWPHPSDRPLQVVRRRGPELFGCERACLLLLDEASSPGGLLTVSAEDGATDARFPANVGLTGRVLSTGAPIHLPQHAYNAEGFHPGIDWQARRPRPHQPPNPPTPTNPLTHPDPHHEPTASTPAIG